MPFADTNIAFVSFLVIAPLVLIAFSFYLHIFLGYWTDLISHRVDLSGSELSPKELPFVFNPEYRIAKCLSIFLFYWLLPIMLGVFTWKALPRPEAPTIISLTTAVLAVFLFLQIRRGIARTYRLYGVFLWIAFFVASVFLIDQQAYSLERRYAPFAESTVLNRRLFSSMRRQLHLERADLSKQDLSSVILDFAQMQEANVASARMLGASLREVDLTNANGFKVDLRNADLEESELLYANLRCADLRDARLRGVDLALVDLTDADLRGADLSEELAPKRRAPSFLNIMFSPVNQWQIDLAVVDEQTKLPAGIRPSDLKKRESIRAFDCYPHHGNLPAAQP